MAEERAEAVAAPKVGKSNLILIVIIAVLATILVGGGITAAIVLTKGGSSEKHADEAASADDTAATDKKKEKGKKDDKGKKDGPKSAAIYVALEPPFVVNFDATQASRFLQVTVEIMTRDSSMAQMIKENDPAIRNDLLILFGSQNANTIAAREGKETLRKETLETVRGVVKGEGGKAELVEAVYFTTFVMQ